MKEPVAREARGFMILGIAVLLRCAYVIRNHGTTPNDAVDEAEDLVERAEQRGHITFTKEA